MILDLLWWVGWLFCAVVVALPLALITVLGPVGGTIAWAMLTPWTTLAAMAAVHRALPASVAGTFKLPGDSGATRWALKGWAPSVYLTLFQPLFFMSTTFQRVALRAFGATLGTDAWVTSRTVIREPHHVTVGDRSLVGEFAHLVCSMQPRLGMLVVGPIRVGSDTLIGAYTHIAPGSVVGSRCVLEHAIALGPAVVIDDDAYVGASTSIYGGSRVGKGARIGKHCVIGTRCVIADGSHLPDCTVMASGETWALEEAVR